ncbi:hypothetical protein VOM14_17255 [Paraburkholderia sp. MPAMCS5]|uniref:hypothetical protein n=1 Tax=Paraburkholderia sp. MPAMCS5 TaxID=3112563 RepID=UPI002E181611|nr:hypothetical protein [Paraburkholderia sp. MPAMCS5]
MQAQPNQRKWSVNDIAGLARTLGEIDPSKYVDEQAEHAYAEALVKWPVMSRLMGLVKGHE